MIPADPEKIRSLSPDDLVVYLRSLMEDDYERRWFDMGCAQAGQSLRGKEKDE